MKQVLLAICLFLVFGFFFQTYAQPLVPTGRFAACDLCGYCPPNQAPSSWPKCKACLYPSTSDNPSDGETLKIVDTNAGPTPGLTSNLAPTPAPGKIYTQLGCLGSGFGGLLPGGDPTKASSGIVQALLNVVFSIIGGLAFLSLIYGSFIIMTSQSNPERLNYGRRIVYGAIAGVIFSLSAVFLVNLIASGILRIPGFSPNTPATP